LEEWIEKANLWEYGPDKISFARCTITGDPLHSYMEEWMGGYYAPHPYIHYEMVNGEKWKRMMQENVVDPRNHCQVYCAWGLGLGCCKAQKFLDRHPYIRSWRLVGKQTLMESRTLQILVRPIFQVCYKKRMLVIARVDSSHRRIVGLIDRGYEREALLLLVTLN
jgi:hypothetical protein